MTSPAAYRPPKPIPIEAVEQLWEQLALTYGHSFLRQWEGFEHQVVREDWAKKLAGITPPQIDYALANLTPGRPIQDALEFRRLCRQMPDPERLALPAPRGPQRLPATVLAAMTVLNEAREDDALPAGVAWARGYVAQWSAHPTLTPFQRQMLAHAREVLRRRDPLLNPPKEDGHVAPPPDATEQ